MAPGTNQDVDVDVVVVGAGPVGLTLANILGLQGVSTLVVDERDTLIDYPRGVGLDDESLRTFQSIGLVDRVLPHTVPNQILRFVDAKRRVLAEMAPPDARFGWPKRNGFVQPLVDAELLRGLDRFEHVEVRWGRPMTSCTETADAVTVELDGGGGRQTCAGPLRRRVRRRPQRHPAADGRVLRRHHVADALAGRRRRQRSARPSQQRSRRRPRTPVCLDLDRARDSPLRVHDSRRRDRRAGRGSGLPDADAGVAWCRTPTGST